MNHIQNCREKSITWLWRVTSYKSNHHLVGGFQPIWKILVKMGSSSPNRDENKNHHLVIQLFSSGKFLEMNRWRSNEWEFQDANEFPMIRCPIDISYTGFAIITWNNTKKIGETLHHQGTIPVNLPMQQGSCGGPHYESGANARCK